MELAWGLVAESDEIYSAKTGKWYPVTESKAISGNRQKVTATGLPKPIIKPAGETVQVRRGVTGEAIDMFRVIFSGETP